MNVSAWAIRNPPPSILLFLILLGLGIWSFGRLPVTYFPVVNVPEINVVVDRTGATPEQLEPGVARPLEDALASLPGIEEMETTITDGRVSVAIEFDLNIPIDRAMADTRDAVESIHGSLPEDIDDPRIERVEADSAPIASYAIEAPGMTAAELSWYVDDTVIGALRGIRGVGQVIRIGGVDREIAVSLDPVALEALGLTAAEVNAHLRARQLEGPAGKSELAGAETILTMATAARSLSEIAATQLSLVDGGTVRLGDIAKISDTHAEPDGFATLDGKEMIGFAVFRTRTASDVTVAAEVEAVIHALDDQDDMVAFSVAAESVSYTEANYHAAMATVEEGALLAIIVVFTFLRDWRATAVAVLALPLSAIPTFFVIDQLGFSLNLLSLLGITLVTGILIDDAIVEIENIVRHRSMGKDPWQAALDASDEIGMAVIAISATIIAVFTPVAFMGGEIGQYFRQFGLTIAVAVFFSLLVARLITPVLAAYFMRGSNAHIAPKGRLMRMFEAFLRRAVAWRWITVSLAAASFAASIMALATLPAAFLPDTDNGQLGISMELPPGTSLATTRNRAEQAARAIGVLPEVRSVLIQGGQGWGGQAEPRWASINLNLAPRSDREHVTQLAPQMMNALALIPDARFEVLNERGERDLSFVVTGADGDAVDSVARAVLRQMAEDPLFVMPLSDGAPLRQELRINVDGDRAADLGVSPEAVAETIRVATVGAGSSDLAEFVEATRTIPVRVTLPLDAREDHQIIATLRVPSDRGTVPLGSVAVLQVRESIAQINRTDRLRRVEIGAGMAAGYSASDGMARVEEFDAVRGIPEGVMLGLTGDLESQGDVFESFAFALVAGIALIMVVLILLFRQVFVPLTILSALPLAISGVVAALVLTGEAMSLPVVIGVLMLVGIVTKNSIMLIDFAMEREATGVPRRVAVVDAACTRVRPIVMTTLAMVAGMVPSALGIGAGGEIRAPMAIVVIGGLLSSTVLSLVVIPAFYSLMGDFGDFVVRTATRLLKPNRPDSASQAAL